jgi:hypothetical protein
MQVQAYVFSTLVCLHVRHRACNHTDQGVLPDLLQILLVLKFAADCVDVPNQI